MHARLIDGKSSLLAFSLMALSFPVCCFSSQLLNPKMSSAHVPSMELEISVLVDLRQLRHTKI